MAKKRILIKLDPKLFDVGSVPYPCTGCKEECGGSHYRHCAPWRKWFRLRWKEVTDALNRKR